MAGLGYLARNDPEGDAFYPKCLFHDTTGWYCPGCGSTRAAYALMHLDLTAALLMNPLLVVALPFLAYRMTIELITWIQRGSCRTLKAWGPKHAWMVPTIIFAFWLIRNLPFWPCTLLAPH